MKENCVELASFVNISSSSVSREKLGDSGQNMN